MFYLTISFVGLCTFTALFVFFQNRRSKIRTMRTMLLFIDSKDKITYSHSLNVGALAALFATHIGAIRSVDASFFEEVAKVHDVGKMSIPDHILQKPDSLTPEEYEIIKQHPLLGDEILTMLLGPTPYHLMILYHQERYNGGGYPFGLSGQQIPYLARVLAIIDTFEALSSDRPYRSGYELKQVFQELEAMSGTSFDPELLDQFLSWINIYPVISAYISQTIQTSEEPKIHFVSCHRRKRELVLHVEISSNQYRFTLNYYNYDWHVKKVQQETHILPDLSEEQPLWMSHT